MSNVETVRQIYAALGRGDIPAILERLSDSVEWEYGVNSTNVPWLQPGRSQAYVGEFFAMQAIVDEAHKLGRKVATHAHGLQSIKEAILAGVDSVEHASLIDNEGIALRNVSNGELYE